MSIDGSVFFDLILAVVILGATLIVVVVAYARILTKFHALKQEEGELQSELDGEESQIRALQSTHQPATILPDGVSKEQKEALSHASSELLDGFRKSIQELQQETINTVRNISKGIEEGVVSEMKDFKEVLQKETVDSQKIVEQKIEEEYKAAQTDVDSYKKEQLKKIDTSIYDILQLVAKEVLGKSLSLGEHEALVTEALEKAKTEGVFKKNGFSKNHENMDSKVAQA